MIDLLNIFGLGTPEIVIIIFVILLLFGAKRLPNLARGLGKGISEFKSGLREIDVEPVQQKKLPTYAPAEEKPQAALPEAEGRSASPVSEKGSDH